MPFLHPPLKMVHKTALDDVVFLEPKAHVYYEKQTNERVSFSVTELKGKFAAPFLKKQVLANMFRCVRSGHKFQSRDGTSKYDGMDQEEVGNTWEADRVFGTYFHLAAESYIEVLSRVGVSWTQLTAETKKQMFLHLPLQIKQPEPFAPSLEVLGAMTPRFTAFLENTFLRQGWKPYRTEMPVHLQAEGFSVAGTIDAIFVREKVSPEGGSSSEYMLVDWKTQSANPETSKLQHYVPITDLGYSQTKKTSFAIQLNIYAYILKKVAGLTMDKIMLCAFVTERKPSLSVSDVLLPIAYDEILVETLLKTYSSHLARERYLRTWQSEDPELPSGLYLLDGEKAEDDKS